MNKTSALIPIYDSRKSFYNKAIIIENEKTIDLYSYDTKVASIIKCDNKELNYIFKIKEFFDFNQSKMVIPKL